MKKFALILLLASAAAFPFSACGSMKMYVPADEPFRSELGSYTEDKVFRAIMLGGTRRGWTMTEVAPGIVRAKILWRSMMVEVEIHYNASGYVATYVDSANLQYDRVSQKIDSNYLRWLRNLDRDIRYEVQVADGEKN